MHGDPHTGDCCSCLPPCLLFTMPPRPHPTLPLQWGWANSLTASWQLAFGAVLVAPLAALRPPQFAVAMCGYGGISFGIAYVLFQPWAVFESMWCFIAVGGFAVPLALGRPPPSTGQRKAVRARR